MKNTLLILLIYFIMPNMVLSQYLGRTDYKTLTNEDFKEKITLEGEVLDISGLNLIKPFDTILLGHYLLIPDREAQKNIHVIDIAAKKYLGLFLDIGDGPNELDSIYILKKINETSFIVYSSYENKYLCYNIEDLLKGNPPFKTGYIKDKVWPNFLNYDKENDILFTAGGRSYEHLLYTEHLGSSEKVGYESVLKPSSGIDKPEVWFHLSQAATTRSENYFAFAYKMVPMIELFNYKKKILTSVLLPHQELPKYHAEFFDEELQVGSTNGAKFEFSDIILSDTYIYALYSETILPWTEETLQNSVVYLLDYEFNPNKMYKLDTHIGSITLQKKTSTIYTIDKQGDVDKTWKILVYHLKE